MTMTMTMSMTQMFFPNPFSTSKHIQNTPFPFSASDGKRQLFMGTPITRVASIPIPYEAVNVEYLKEEFSGRGVTFEGLGGDCVAKLSLRNGSAAVLMLPSALLTSYKVAMWHGGTDEMLHSTVVPTAGAAAKVLGGVSLPLEFCGEDGLSWAPRNWALHQIRGSSKNSIQVELISTDSGDGVEIKYIVTLLKEELKSELLISNSKSSSIQLYGCILSHLRVSSPEATYAIGLQASDFFKRPPFMSSCAIIPPDYGLNKGSRVDQLLNKVAFWRPRDQSNGNETKSQQPEEEMEGEETDNYKNLREEMSLMYTSAPRNITIIDRGRRNSVIVGRKGFSELYMFSPGSSYPIYDEYSYVCLGQSAMLKPLTVGPEQELRLGQDLHNPNL